MAKDLVTNLDLNLLRVFTVLFQEKNMRRASERLNVTQPAVSQSLKRLRQHFDEPLFVKVTGGLAATGYAEQLYDLVSPNLEALFSGLSHLTHFSPEELKQPITIALSPPAMMALSGALILKFKQLAPNVPLSIVAWSGQTITDLSNGSTLIGVHYGDIAYPKAIHRHQIALLTAAVAVRKGHPLLKEERVFEQLSNYPIASQLIPEWNEKIVVAAQIMERHGMELEVGFRAEDSAVLVDVISQTDMFMPITNLFPKHRYKDIAYPNVQVPKQERYHPLYCYHHLRQRNSPLITWLYQIIQQTVEEQIELNADK
ncbi:LysR family transcriptional regulator [Vibrio inusitatus]|nr:LysR family transcriptional regulator [Vibrio inusitatus]